MVCYYLLASDISGEEMRIAKHKDWMILNLPCLAMFLLVLSNVQYTKDVLLYSGYIAAILLIIVLTLNPLIRIFKHYDFLRKINRHRRIIGVAVFIYAALHIACFFIKKGSFDITIIFKSPVLGTGFATFLILLPLAITSNNFSIKKLMLPRWKNLHRFAYFAEFALFMHLLLQLILFNKSRTIYILIAFLVLFILQILRLRVQR